ncbi:MAG: RagB/SusD family nutrient uptake outer membrane protein [Chitinophagaceae bacterium]
MSYRIKILTLLAVVVMTACNKKLDVQPQNTITPDQIKTADDVKAVLFGGYSTFQNANAMGEKYNTFSELLINDNDINWVGTYSDYDDLFTKGEVTTTTSIYEVWANSYHSINVANIVLSKLDVLSADERDAIEGEAKFFRGAAYYYLVNFYAIPYSAGSTSSNPGVPLILAPVEGYVPSRDKLPRASVEAVYAQIVADLQDAASKMPETADNGRATKYSALGFLSRVYLSMAKYDEAADAASQVIESGEFALNTTFDKAFNNATNTPEDVFAIQQTSQSNSGTNNFGMTTFYSAQPTGRGDIQVTDEHIAKYEPNDDRGAFFYAGSSINGNDGMMTSKWKDIFKAIPVIRLAEMYLTRAEANFRKGGAATGPNTPLDDVNVIRNRAGLSSLGAISDADVIVNERYLELAFEGERLFTVKRLQLTVEGRPYNDPKLILPIPQREIDLGNSLPQNGSY